MVVNVRKMALQLTNVKGSFAFEFALQKDQMAVWKFSRSGSGIIGKGFEHTLTVTADGEVLED